MTVSMRKRAGASRSSGVRRPCRVGLVAAFGLVVTAPAQALQLSPEFTRPLLAVLAALTSILAAIVIKRRRVESRARDIQAVTDRAKILQRNGRPDAAAKEIDGLRLRRGKLPLELHLLMIQALFEANEDDRADVEVENFSTDALDLKQRYEFARMLERGGRKERAEELYKTIQREDADYADVNIRLDRLEGGGSGPMGAGMIGFGYDPSSISRALANRYMKMELVGKGGMGFVFKAFDQKRKRTVALKALSPFLADEEEAVRRFMREAKILAKFEHPNVVKIFDVDDDPLVYYSMEFLEGRTLGHRLEEEGPLTVKELLWLADSLLSGLIHIHKHDVVHRDIKPENILLDSDGTPRLTDFGLAVGDKATRITQAGQVMGTLRYMAPEQMRGEDVGPRADLFSLGVSLYEALTGIHAFTGEDRVHRQLTGRVHEVTEKEIPPDVVAFIELLMEKRPEDRLQSAEDALQMVRMLRRQVTRKGPATFLSETLTLRARAIRPLVGFFQALGRGDEQQRREFFEESSNVRDLKLLVWGLNEAIGRIQAAGKPPVGCDPRLWAPETGRLRTDLARFVRYLDLDSIETFAARLTFLGKALDAFLSPFQLHMVEKILRPLEQSYIGEVFFRLPTQDFEVYAVPVSEVRDHIVETIRGLIEAGRPTVQELVVRWKMTPEGDRVLLQINGDGIEKGHDEAEGRFVAIEGEVSFPEPGVFKVWLPLVLEPPPPEEAEDPNLDQSVPSFGLSGLK